MRGRIQLVGWLGLLSIGSIVGCGPDAKDMQIQKLQEDAERWRAENGDLSQRLTSAQGDADAARSRALDLQRMLDEARRDLANRPTLTEYIQSPPIVTQAPASSGLPEGFQGNQSFAWTELDETILFDSGKADLKATGRSALQTVVSRIQSQSEWAGNSVFVIGHTDSDPIKRSKWADNLELSVQRGATVVRELKKMGLDPQRLVAAGQGEYNPLLSNSSRDGKAKNRRVQIAVVAVPLARSIAP